MVNVFIVAILKISPHDSPFSLYYFETTSSAPNFEHPYIPDSQPFAGMFTYSWVIVEH